MLHGCCTYNFDFFCDEINFIPFLKLIGFVLLNACGAKINKRHFQLLTYIFKKIITSPFKICPDYMVRSTFILIFEQQFSFIFLRNAYMQHAKIVPHSQDEFVFA